MARGALRQYGKTSKDGFNDVPLTWREGLGRIESDVTLHQHGLGCSHLLCIRGKIAATKVFIASKESDANDMVYCATGVKEARVDAIHPTRATRKRFQALSPISRQFLHWRAGTTASTH